LKFIGYRQRTREWSIPIINYNKYSNVKLAVSQQILCVYCGADRKWSHCTPKSSLRVLINMVVAVRTHKEAKKINLHIFCMQIFLFTKIYVSCLLCISKTRRLTSFSR